MLDALSVIQISLVVLAFAGVGVALFAIVWFAVRTLFQKLGLPVRYVPYAPGVVVAIATLVAVVANVDGLDSMETVCQTAALASGEFSDAKNVRVQEHYNFWTTTYSGSSVYPWISRPGETPKVSLFVRFEKANQPNSKWVNCRFARPGTKDSTGLSMESMQIGEQGGFPGI